MIGTNFMEELDCGSFFDHIDDLLEFPNDDINDNGSIVGKSVTDAFPSLCWQETSVEPDFPCSDSVFSNTNSASDLSAELSVPYEDIVQLEWLSTFVEDSFAGRGLTVDNCRSSSPKDSSSGNQFQTSSPISVLESSSACSNGKRLPVSHEKRARSKRPRPPTFVPRKSIQQLIPSTCYSSVTHHQPTMIPLSVSSSESESFGESCPVELQKKKKKIKILPPTVKKEVQNDNPDENPPSSQTVRKCTHCEITKTPQWRAGPLGPKTLCNACGVRYKSGRLFPEYRPAASPTFSPSLHSNSHKKVVEMRCNNPTGEGREELLTPATAIATADVTITPAVSSPPTACM